MTSPAMLGRPRGLLEDRRPLASQVDQDTGFRPVGYVPTLDLDRFSGFRPQRGICLLPSRLKQLTITEGYTLESDHVLVAHYCG